MNPVEFSSIRAVFETRTLSNGDYVLAKVTTENGVRTIHTLNPNVHERYVFDYAESDAMLM